MIIEEQIRHDKILKEFGDNPLYLCIMTRENTPTHFLDLTLYWRKDPKLQQIENFDSKEIPNILNNISWFKENYPSEYASIIKGFKNIELIQSYNTNKRTGTFYVSPATATQEIKTTEDSKVGPIEPRHTIYINEGDFPAEDPLRRKSIPIYINSKEIPKISSQMEQIIADPNFKKDMIAGCQHPLIFAFIRETGRLPYIKRELERFWQHVSSEEIDYLKSIINFISYAQKTKTTFPPGLLQKYNSYILKNYPLLALDIIAPPTKEEIENLEKYAHLLEQYFPEMAQTLSTKYRKPSREISNILNDETKDNLTSLEQDQFIDYCLRQNILSLHEKKTFLIICFGSEKTFTLEQKQALVSKYLPNVSPQQKELYSAVHKFLATPFPSEEIKTDFIQQYFRHAQPTSKQCDELIIQFLNYQPKEKTKEENEQEITRRKQQFIKKFSNKANEHHAKQQLPPILSGNFNVLTKLPSAQLTRNYPKKMTLTLNPSQGSQQSKTTTTRQTRAFSEDYESPTHSETPKFEGGRPRAYTISEKKETTKEPTKKSIATKLNKLKFWKTENKSEQTSNTNAKQPEEKKQTERGFQKK